MSDPLSSLLDSLRRQTRADHHALDAHPILVSLVRPGLDLDRYAEALSALHPAQRSLEGIAIEGLRDLAMAYPFASRMEWLEADLERLGVASPVVPWRGPAPPSSLAELVGLLYVLEGSRLGARVIAERVRDSLGDAVPLSFFDNADGERAWPIFRHFAVTHCPVEGTEAAIRSARQAFVDFRARLGTSRVLDLSPTD